MANNLANHFRAEIAGLRAVAVIGVVLFHLKVDGFQGGFVGVDIFFVISGYLITRNILADLQAGRFSFGQFYVRRTRRIYPALIFTVVATYLAGALWCSPLMFLDVAKEGTHALLSISNIQYWRESRQYFAPNSDELALLHCWSLSLEEQFYLLWPVLIVLAWRVGRTFEGITVAALASIVASTLVSRVDPLAVFFLMPFRISEFACGALVLLVERRFRLGEAAAECLSAIGLLCIAASVLLFKSDMPHLDAAILLPCLGAAATIWASGKTRVSTILTNATMVSIGAISYSLYLCHWPIIFFARFIFGDDAANGWAGILTMAVVMVAVATAMNLFIERRFIQSSELRSASVPRNAVGFWSVVLALVAVTHFTFKSQGFAWRMPAAQAELEHLEDFPNGRDIRRFEGPVGFELIGDSLTAEYAFGLGPIMEQLNINVHVMGGAGCPILYGATLKSPRQEECRLARDQTLQRVAQTNLPIIFVQKWSLYSDAAINEEVDSPQNAPSSGMSFTKLQLGLERTIGKLVADGRHILIIGEQLDPGCPINRPRLLQGPLPHAPQPPCAAKTREEAERSTSKIDQILSAVQAKWPDKVELLRPIDYFCDTECPVVKDGIWFYSNRIHLTLAGSTYMVSRSGDVIRRFLEN
jgi:peptidoglycan/LPS O-acetylase OafA/YrhL